MLEHADWWLSAAMPPTNIDKPKPSKLSAPKTACMPEYASEVEKERKKAPGCGEHHGHSLRLSMRSVA